MATEERPKHLYRHPRSPYWWLRIGRGIRRSTRLLNLQDAIAYRDAYLKKLYGERATSDWAAWIAEQLKDGNSWLRLTHSRMRRKSARRGWPTCMTLAELAELVKGCNGRCQVTGIGLVRPSAETKRAPLNASIDRRDSSLGYTFENCRVVCLAINIAMGNWGEETVRVLARRLVARELAGPE